MIHSMTGFASTVFSSGDESFRIEVKSLNHRFLDLKLRIPREFQAFEAPLRSLLESRLKRGSVDFWVERQGKKSGTVPHTDLARARIAYQELSRLRSEFGIREEITLRDLVSFPDVLTTGSAPERTDAEQAALEKDFLGAAGIVIDDLLQMRRGEGERLCSALFALLEGLKEAHGRLLAQRETVRSRAREKIKKRIEQCFEAYPVADDRVRALLESRVAQEIAYSLEKLDIEEELTRFQGHLLAVEQLLREGGAVGKRLDFLFQELNREVNTLANKSQDLDISREAIALKAGIEQLREQSLNLE
jgi:uncharacterized protein (TIGR00255 family)